MTGFKYCIRIKRLDSVPSRWFGAVPVTLLPINTAGPVPMQAKVTENISGGILERLPCSLMHSQRASIITILLILKLRLY